MRISTKGRYALRLMLDIAMNDAEGKPVRVKDIAKRQEVSGKYLEQIVSVLTKAGYLRSIRGPQGGYLLTKHPDEYTVFLAVFAIVVMYAVSIFLSIRVMKNKEM